MSIWLNYNDDEKKSFDEIMNKMEELTNEIRKISFK